MGAPGELMDAPMVWRVGRGFLAALVGASGAVALAVTSAASAKASLESPYGIERTWNAALRLVRVDNGWKIEEKDEASGYLLFDYRSPESPKPSPGSIELIRGREGTSVVGVLVQLSQMPHYHEQMLLDALSSKMRREYGDPPVAKRARPGFDDGPVEAGTD